MSEATQKGIKKREEPKSNLSPLAAGERVATAKK